MTYPDEQALLPVIDLAERLRAEGRWDDSLILMRHAAALDPHQAAQLEQSVIALSQAGKLLDALQNLALLVSLGTDPMALVGRHEPLIRDAFVACQGCYDRGDAAGALSYLTPLCSLLPDHWTVLSMTLSCARVLEDFDLKGLCAQQMLTLRPQDPEALSESIAYLRRIGNQQGEAELRWRFMLLEPPAERLNHGCNIYDLINLLMCQPLTLALLSKIARAQTVLDQILFDPTSSEIPDRWIRFYRAMIGGVHLPALLRTDWVSPVGMPSLWDGRGQSLSLGQAKARAGEIGAKTVFLVAGDPRYIERYAKIYIRSVLRNTDLPCLVLVHVIGGADKLAEIIRDIGETDRSVLFSTEDFNPTQIRSTVLDAPSQPAIDKPIAHYQSARFHQAVWILREFGLPLFITDIDCILERGVGDLVAKAGKVDLMLNENHVVVQFGARITANLLLLFPTQAAQSFLTFVSAYLAERLQSQDLSKFIDQITLGMAQHYVRLHFPTVKIEYFNVDTDINNCMLAEYGLHPFRFLSLYQKFKLETLPQYQS